MKKAIPKKNVPKQWNTPIPKPKKNCKNPKDYASIFFETFDWFDIVEKLSIFADNMQIDLDLEYNVKNKLKNSKSKFKTLKLF